MAALDTVPSTGNLARVSRYRAKHRRIDYVPSAAALAVVEAWLARELDNCMAGVIDRLVLAGDQAMSGNGPKGMQRDGAPAGARHPDRAGGMQ